MKKFASLILVLMLCMALCIPAFAQGEPTEITPQETWPGIMEIYVEDGGDYIIKEDCELYSVEVPFGSLTIAEGVSVTVNMNFSCWKNCTITVENGAVFTIRALACDAEGTINVHGDLDIRECPASFYGVINKYCDGNIYSNTDISGIIRYPDHIWNGAMCVYCGADRCEVGVHDWKNGKCNLCGTECDHSFNNGVCTVCGMGAVGTGSTLSEGSLTIIVGVACLAVGFLAAMIIFKKKKPVLASGTDNTDEE